MAGRTILGLRWWIIGVVMIGTSLELFDTKHAGCSRTDCACGSEYRRA